MDEPQSIVRARFTKPYPCIRCGRSDTGADKATRNGMCPACYCAAQQNVPLPGITHTADNTVPSIPVDALECNLLCKRRNAWKVIVGGGILYALIEAIAITLHENGWTMLGYYGFGLSFVAAGFVGVVYNQLELMKRFGLGR